MYYTNEFLKYLVAHIIDQLDEQEKDSDESMEVYKDNKNSKEYSYHLGQWSLADRLRKTILEKLAREAMKKEEVA